MLFQKHIHFKNTSQKNLINHTQKKFESYNNFYIFRFSIIENITKMKKILFALILSVFVGSAFTSNVYATTTVNSVITIQDSQDEPMMEATSDEASAGFTQELKKRFIEGGPSFMGIVLICLILGLAISIERIIYLNLSTTNTEKLTGDVEDALKSGGVEAAKEVCRNTKGPVASIFYQGLDRAKDGVDSAEKAVISYGGVQMGQLEKNVSWISLFIALAPMLGFMGTVIGMITALIELKLLEICNHRLLQVVLKLHF